jgi:dihydroflavonol-4-reductase
LVALDVRDGEAFERALQSIEVVFHVAATYKSIVADEAEAEELMRDAVDGTRAAMQAAARAGVRKVVLTSSVVTLPYRDRGGPPATEADWTDNTAIPYFRAKVESEREAWRLAKELNQELVTVLPGGIGGPGFTRRTPTIELIEGMLLGSMRFGAPRLNFSYVDARDVARAHILAAEKSVDGRFIVCNDEQPSIRGWSQAVHEADPSAPAAPWELPGFMTSLLPMLETVNQRLFGIPRFVSPESVDVVKGRWLVFDNSRARRELGWSPQWSFVDSLRDTTQAIRELRRREGQTRGV